MKTRLYMASLVALIAVCSGVRAADDVIPLEVDSPDPKLAKIVLVAGEQSGNIAHQYWAGTTAIYKLLQGTPGLHVSVVRGGWPKNPDLFNNAKAIVLFMEGGEGGTIHPLSAPGRLEIIEKAMKQGAGLVTLHKAGAIPDELGTKMLDLQGGYYDFKASSKGHWLVDFHTFVEHPITRGMKPFSLNDGYCIGIKFAPDMKGVTPLLFAPKGNGKIALSAESTTASKDITAWAFERPDAGRTFVFTGLHSHRYLTELSIRKLTINGILWAAKLEVPVDGAKVDLDPAELEKNLEPLAKAPVKAPAKK
ncbi:MAG: ThuA domain-containing protein [Planctomycetota bacterium]